MEQKKGEQPRHKRDSSSRDRQYHRSSTVGVGIHDHVYKKFVQEVREITDRYGNYERRRVREGEPAWPSYRSLISNIEASMREYIPSISFRKFLTQRREESGQTFVLDVMGSGGFIGEDYSVDGEVAITLIDHRSQEQQDEEALYGKNVIAGNVLDETTWECARAFLQENDERLQPGFDLITCNPGAGWDLLHGLEAAPSVLTRQIERDLIQQMVTVLNPTGGKLYIHKGSFFSENTQWSEWVTQVNELAGYDASLHERVLTITKLAEEGSDLPEIPV